MYLCPLFFQNPVVKHSAVFFNSSVRYFDSGFRPLFTTLILPYGDFHHYHYAELYHCELPYLLLTPYH